MIVLIIHWTNEKFISKNKEPFQKNTKKANIEFNKEIYSHVEEKKINIPKDIKI